MLLRSLWVLLGANGYALQLAMGTLKKSKTKPPKCSGYSRGLNLSESHLQAHIPALRLAMAANRSHLSLER